jgi:phosphoglycerate dehydrogenase-like enzyme
VKVVSFTGRWREELQARLDEGIRLCVVDPADLEAMRRELPDAAVLITTSFDARLTPLCASLRLILCPAAGTERIDRNALPAGVEVINGVGHEQPMAEYVIGALVAMRQRFAAADAALRRGRWTYGFFGKGAFVEELYGSSLGIVGYGRIGVEIAKRAVAFGMRCGAVTFHPGKPFDRTLLALGLGDISNGADVDRLVAGSDAVVCACELSPVTAGLLDARRLGTMRPNAVLVNVARGPIVDERALFDALQHRRLAGAAIDVWYRYPEDGGDASPADLPFNDLDDVLMTPHSSGWTAGAQTRKLHAVAEQINEFRRGVGP